MIDGRGWTGRESEAKRAERRRSVSGSEALLYSHSRLCRDAASSVLFIGSPCPPRGALIGWPRPGNPRPSAAARRGPEAIGRGAVREPRGGASETEKKERERGSGGGDAAAAERGRGRRCWKVLQPAFFSDLWTLRPQLRLPQSHSGLGSCCLTVQRFSRRGVDEKPEPQDRIFTLVFVERDLGGGLGWGEPGSPGQAWRETWFSKPGGAYLPEWIWGSGQNCDFMA